MQSSVDKLPRLLYDGLNGILNRNFKSFRWNFASYRQAIFWFLLISSLERSNHDKYLSFSYDNGQVQTEIKTTLERTKLKEKKLIAFFVASVSACMCCDAMWNLFVLFNFVSWHDASQTNFKKHYNRLKIHLLRGNINDKKEIWRLKEIKKDTQVVIGI